jgi:hypothetical protein
MRRVLPVLITLPAVLLFCKIARADDFQIIPSLSARQEYNDNIFLSEADTIDDFITTLSGGLEVIERTERLDSSLSARVARFFYADNTELNEIDQFYRGRINYRMTPKLDFGGNAAYIVDHRPDRDVAVSGLPLGSERRSRLDVAGNLGYRVSEITAASMSYELHREDFNGRKFTDFETRSAVVGVTQDLSAWLEATVGRSSFGYQHYDSDTSEVDSLVCRLGGLHRFSERLNLDVELGARYTDSTFDTIDLVLVPPDSDSIQPTIIQESKTGFGGLGQINLDYNWERTFGRFAVGHDIQPASGTVGVANRTALTFTLHHRPSYNMNIGLFAGFFRNRADADQFSANEIDLFSITIRPTFRWKLDDNFTLEGGYMLSYLDNKADDTKTHRNFVFLQIACGIPLPDLDRIFN